MAWVAIPDFSKGLNLDATPEESAPGITVSGKNIRYRAGYAERFHGTQTAYNTPTVTPYHIANYTVGSSYYVVYAGLQRTFADDGSTLTEITNGNNSGGINDRFCGFSFNGVYVQNNGVDVPQYWGGTGTLQALPNWPAGYKAGFMRPYKNFLICGDVTRAGVRQRSTVLWSNIADPGTVPQSWDIADPTKLAGDNSLSETNGTLIDALPLGDVLAIYKDDSVFYAQAVDSTDVFRFGRFPSAYAGLMSRGCVANTPVGHVLLTPEVDLVRFDGSTMQSVLTGRMRKWLNDNINKQQGVRAFVCVNPLATEVLACIPYSANTTCGKAIVWNWKDDTLAIRELTNATYATTGPVSVAGAYTWNTLTGTWNSMPVSSWSDFSGSVGLSRLVLANTTPSLALFDSTEQEQGANFTAQMDMTGMHFDQPEAVKMCRAVRPKLDGAAGAVVQVQIGSAMVPDGAITWQTAVPFTVGTTNQIDSFATGRYLALRFYTNDATWWRLRSAQLDIVPVGAY